MLELLAFALLAPDAIEEIVVTSSRRAAPRADHPGNIAVIGKETIEATSHAHIHELLTRVAGVWVVRASGQESLPSIRSPVLTGPGSCGAFLTLEDGVPTRPAGFCNVNQLFELPTELARSIEVIRGPGNALYGSNALHGTVNVLLPTPEDAAPRLDLELGSNDFVRFAGRASLAAGTTAGVVLADDGGFRDDSGYRQGKLHVGHERGALGGTLSLTLTASDLDQQTAGFIPGKDAYKDPDLRTANLNPEAYREAASQRLTAHWRGRVGGLDLDVRPYFRHSDMEFLQHFLPGQPLEENGHVSAGVLTMLTSETERRSISAGVDIEWADVFLKQTQYGPTEGSDFLRETRPEGKHYDYDVTSIGIAAFMQSDFDVTERVTVSAGLRVEHLHYDYVNNMLDGNTRDDGTPCGFGGCLYTRPSDRRDDFTDLAPKLGVRWELSDAAVAYANVARGFRAPQMTELYRLQSGQQVSDLDTETIDSAEVGLRGGGDTWYVDTSVFAMRKKNSIYRDASGYNVSGGRSRHRGVEVLWNWQPRDNWLFVLTGTWARHQYDFDALAARGEAFVSGNDVDTAPRWQGSADIRYDVTDAIHVALQWVSLGEHYIDAANEHTYPGHDLLNFRIGVRAAEALDIVLRVNNLADDHVADRADFAFGNYRYFPARGREFFVRFSYRP